MSERETIEAVAAYVNTGAEIATEDDTHWNGVHECRLVDTLIEMTIIDWMTGAIQEQHAGDEIVPILHILGHRFIQMGMGIAIQEELR